jgi:hypothetical protein
VAGRQGRRCKQLLDDLKERAAVAGRLGRRRKQLLDDVKETTEYWKLKDETLHLTLWRIRFGRAYGRVLRQTVE